MSKRKTATQGKQPAKHRSSLVGDIRILGKVWRFQPLYVLLLILHALVWAFVDAMAVYYRAELFDALDVGAPFWEAAKWIVFTAGFYLLLFLPDFIYTQIIRPILERRLQTKLLRELYRKAQSLDIACYDDPAFYDQFVWAMREAAPRAMEVLNALENILHYFLSSLAILGLLFTINPVVSLLMLVGNFLGTFVLDSCANRMWIKFSERITPLWRRDGYLDRVYTLSDYAKEMRTGQFSEMAMRDLEGTFEEYYKASRWVGKRSFLFYGVGWNLLQQSTRYITLFVMIGELASGDIQLGGFAAAVSALWMLGVTMQTLSDHLAVLPRCGMYLEKYFAFLDHENTMQNGTAEVPPFETLTFEHVSFGYASVRTEAEVELEARIRAYNEKRGEKPDEAPPEAPRGDVLQDVCLTLRRGEKLAIVGYNGAGKTTLIKLILRLYDPTEGRILYNGRDIREFDVEDYRAHIGAVFQDYRIFAATVAENVMGGVYSGTPEEESAVREALDASTFSERLAEMEQGLDTPLTREIDQEGVNLSGGEAQKVAIARVFVRPYELIVMDEPSSALDPVAEYELNHSILHAADTRDRTVIFISHRLSTTRFADRILLFADGRLCESGSHDQLMEQNGTYATMFRMQAKNYREDA